MTTAIGIMLLVVSLAYSFFFLYLAFRVDYPAKSEEGKITADVFVSVVVPLRNEAANVEVLLKGLLSQDYDCSCHEIILVDDHSEDDTLTRISLAERDNPHVHVVCLPEGARGKKEAIRLGISRARGALIMTTDADCKVPPRWISVTVAYYKHTGASLIIGPVKIAAEKGSGIFGKLQSLEFTSLVGTGAALAMIGRPALANGANLAIEKEAYPQKPAALVPGTPSGDDIFLLLHIKKSSRGKISFLFSEDAVVSTIPASAPGEFLQQRTRWLSKGKYYRDAEIIGLAALVGLMNVALLASGILAWLEVPALFLPFILLLVKTTTDTIFLYPWLKFFRQTSLAPLIPLVEIAYPFYMILTGIRAATGKTSWKNRKYSLL